RAKPLGDAAEARLGAADGEGKQPQDHDRCEGEAQNLRELHVVHQAAVEHHGTAGGFTDEEDDDVQVGSTQGQDQDLDEVEGAFVLDFSAHRLNSSSDS